MIHSRIDSGTLRDRLDASYYTPEVLENEAQLRARGATTLRTLIDTDASNYGVLPPSGDYLPSGSGVPLIRGGDLDGGAIRDPEVDAPLSFKNARGTANVGDVLLLIKGACIDSPAGVALVSERHAGSVFNGSCYRVKVALACDAGYLVAYCQTRQLLLQKKREIANTGIAYNAEDSVLGYLVPALSLDAQRYIGDKVRQAERLRERARRLCDSVRLYHLGQIPEFRPSKAKWNTYRLAPRAIEDVIVPHFYPPAVTEYLAGRRNKPLTEICTGIYSGETYDADEKGVDQATSRSCSGRFLKRPCNRVRPPARVDLDLQSHDVLLTNAAHDKAYIGSDVTYYHGGPRNIPSAKVMVLRPNRAVVPASYLYTYLRTPVGYLQVQSAIRGISAGIRAQDIGTIRIPLPAISVSELDAWLSMDSLMADAGASEDAASWLCASATSLVEQLLDGRRTEAELVAAQKALEAGDRGADREILKALRQSDTPDTKPLIGDVDALYALLDEIGDKDA